MELQRETAADHERLRGRSIAGDFGRAGRQGPAVEVPLEPRPGRHQRGIVGVDTQPAEFRCGRRRYRATVRSGEKLTAETHAQHRDTRRVRVAQQSDLLAHPGQRGVVGCPPRAQRHDDVVAAGFGERHVDRGGTDPRPGHHLERLDVEPVVGERFCEQSGRRHRVVDDEQDLARHATHFPGGCGGASSDASSAPILRNNVSASLA